MKRIFFTTLFLIAVSLNANAGIIFIEWTTESGGNGHFYGLTEDEMNWTEAEAVGVSMGGHLTSITSAEEQDFINTNFLSGANDTSVYWIGLNDVDQEDVWIWSNGDDVDYLNWAPGEPNDYDSGQDYVEINWQYGRGFGAKGQWVDDYNEGTIGFQGVDGPYQGIIELNALPVPEPSFTILLSIGLGAVLLTRKCFIK